MSNPSSSKEKKCQHEVCKSVSVVLEYEKDRFPRHVQTIEMIKVCQECNALHGYLKMISDCEEFEEIKGLVHKRSIPLYGNILKVEFNYEDLKDIFGKVKKDQDIKKNKDILRQKLASLRGE